MGASFGTWMILLGGVMGIGIVALVTGIVMEKRGKLR